MMWAQKPCQTGHLLIHGLVFGILLISTVINAESACRKGCLQSDNGPTKYTPGNVYEYALDSMMTVGTASTGLNSNNDDDTSLKMVGTAKIFAEGNCGYTLQLSAIKVTATKKKDFDKKLLQSLQKPVHFTMSSGTIEPEICTDASDTAYALNIKRAVISLFQSSSTSENEIDLFGQCPTRTSITKVGNADVVSKVRDLNNCAHREKINSGIITGIINEKAGIRSTNLLQSNYFKELRIENGVVENVQLLEDYKFIGSPKESPVVKAKVVTKLKIKNKAGSPAAPPTVGAKAASIIYEQPETYSAKNLAALKIALADVVKSIESYVQNGSAKLFVELIHLMRNADADTLLELATVPYPNKTLSRKVYLDALFRAGTTESAKAILKQFNKLDEKEKNYAVLSLYLIQVVDKETVNQASTLLTPNASKEVFLSVGNIVSKYCHRNGCDNGEIDLISRKFTDLLKNCKANTRKDEDRLVYLLKGIDNMDYLVNNVVTALAQCSSSGRSARLRISALQAFKSGSCDPALQKQALDILKNRNEDSEIRIEAYLAAINCPSAELANEIAEVVNSETIYQVGGFITSNLKAIRDSTDPAREQQRRHFSNIRVTKNFPKDLRRYSNNKEFSYNFDALGLSASSDYKIIYSQQGFLPRSAQLNVTAEVFGTNFNIFEAKIRQENIESVLETHIGPKGLLSKDWDSIIKTTLETVTGSRSRRSIADDSNNFAKKYKNYGSKSSQDINLDLSLKLFGSEIMFLSFDDNVPTTLPDLIKFLAAGLEKVKQELSSFHKEFLVHSLFLDAELAYPTGLGVPLEIAAQGFAANKLDFAIGVDVDAIFEQNWKAVNYRLKVVPSVDINLNVKFGFNAHVLSTGLQVSTNLHSAAGSDVSFSFINEGNGFNIDIELPREKLELVNLQIVTDFYLAEQDKPVESIKPKGLKKDQISPPVHCFDQLENYVGVNVCVTSFLDDTLSTKLIDITQPYQFNVYVTSERKLNIKGYHDEQTPTQQQWKLDFSTPGSKVNHDTSVALEFATTNAKIFGRLTLNNPNYHLALEAGVSNTNKELVFYTRMEQDGDVKHNKIGFEKNGNDYIPKIQVGDKNDLYGYRADGKLVIENVSDKIKRYRFENLQVSNNANERVIANGWTEIGPAHFSSELHISPGQQKYFIKSGFRADKELYNLALFVNDENTPENIIGSSVEVKRGPQNIGLDLVIKALTWEINSVNEYNYEQPESDSGEITSASFSNLLNIKKKQNLIGSLKINGLTASDKYELNIDIERSKGRLASLAVKYNENEEKSTALLYDYRLDINAKLNKHTVDIMSKCTNNGNRNVIDNVLTTSWGTALTVKGELGQRYTVKDIYIDLQGNIKLSGKEKQTQWTLNVVGAPEKLNTEVKILRDNSELLKGSADINIQDKMNVGKVNINVKNVFTTKVDFKINKNGKGDVTAVVETQKTEPKHKLEVASKFTIQSPKFDVEASVILDSTKKFNFKTENIVDKQKFTTKNIAEFGDKKTTFDANAAVKGEWQLNGEVQANFVFKCPSGHTIDGSVKRKVLTNPKTGLAHGNLEVLLNDSHDDKKASLSVTANLEKYSVKSKEIVTNSQLVFTNYNNKKLDVTYEIKHLVKGDNVKTLDISIASQGDLLKTNYDLKLNIDEYNSQHAKFRATAKCTENNQLSVTGNYNLAEAGQPATFDVEAVLQAPNSEFKTFSINTHGKLLKPVAEKDGNYIAQFEVDQKQGNAQFFKLNTLLEGSHSDGNYNLNLETNKMQGPLKIISSFRHDQKVNLDEGTARGKENYAFSYEYANKFVKTTSDISFVTPNSATVHLTMDSSFDAFNEIDAEIAVKKLDGNNYGMNIQFKQHQDVHKLDSKWYHSTNKNGFDIQISLPSGKPITLIGVFEILGEKKAKVSVELENVVDLDLKANAEAAYKSLDDFYVLAEWNSKKLKLQDYNLNIQAQSKSITLNLKHAQGVVFSGTATYLLKKESNKSIIEGQGQVQYNGKNENVNFKLIRQLYDLPTDKEIGFSYTLNSNFGPLNGVSTIKITNKEYNVKLSVCEEKKQCNNIQLQSLVSIDESELDSLQHSILILIDLRQLGYPYEFEFQSKTLRKGVKFQYNLDSKILSNNNYKYQLIASVVPNSSKVQVILPNREILYTLNQQYPANGAVFGHYESSSSFYFDKLNKPNDVTRVVFSTDLTGVQNVAINANGKLKFEHPSTRTLSVSGKLDANRETQLVNAELVFDIFRLPEQKIVASSRTQNIVSGNGFNITTSHEVHSAGLGLQYDLSGYTAFAPEQRALSAGLDVHGGTNDLQGSIYLYASKDNAEASVYAMSEQILHAKSEFNRQNYATKFESKLQLLSQKSVEVYTDLQPTFAKIVLKRPGLFDANAELKLGKDIKFNVDTAGKQLITGQIALDSANFLHTTYQSNPDDIKLFLETAEQEIKKDTEVARENIKNRFEKLRLAFEQQVHLAKESVPDFTELSKIYQNNINEIAQELESDPTLKQFAETYRKLYKKLSKTAEGIAQTTAEVYKQLSENVVAIYEKWEVIMNESIIPVWESLVINITEVVGQLRIQIFNYYTKVSEYTLKLLERYGPELRNYSKSLTEALKPFNEFLQELLKTGIRVSEELIQEIQEYIANLPTFDAIRSELKEQLEKLKISEKVIKLISDVFEHLYILPQTEESQEFLHKLKEYIDIKLRQQPTQDEVQIEELLKLLVKALRSIYESLELSKTVKLGNNSLDSVLPTLPYVADILNKLPALLTFRLSVLNSILNENLENILSLDYFKSWILFRDFHLKGLIADGHHIFTFDGQHFSYPGTCKYIVAQDSVNSNFTVVAQLNNGKLKSIILADRDGNFLELSDAGTLKFNGNFVEFPLHSTDMHAWRTYNNIWLHSSYGVEVICTNDLKLCHVNVNGFYTSKTRGLLGNGNAEPEDDFTQVDGTIAANYATFSNNYGLGKCQAVPKRSDAIENTDLCNKIFGLDSPLALGYIFENNAPYRKACDIAVTDAAEKEKESAACTIASAYGSTLQLKKHIIMLPPQCLKCSGAAGQRDLGSEFTVKLPNKQADLVFVIDVGATPAVLNNLVAPAVTEIRETLKARGFTDVQISVVAYNESERYPALLTSGKGKLNYQGSVVDVELNGPKNSNLRSLIADVIDEKSILDVYDVIERIIKHVVPQSDSKAFNLALEYPFRSGAVKSIIAVRSEPLEFGNMFKLLRAHLTEAVTNFDGATVHLLSPVNKMSLEGVADEKLIGFNSRLIATVDGKDAKKRPKLHFENNLGIDVVLNNGGWIFNTQNFDTLNAQDKKKMLSQVTNSIADTLFKTDIVSDCKCLPVHGLYAQHKCSIKSSTFLPNKKVKAA